MKNTIKLFTASVLLCGMTFTVSAQTKPMTKTSKMQRLEASNGDVEDIAEVADAKLVGISGWPAFNDLVTGMRKVEGMDVRSSYQVIQSLLDPTADLMNTRPKWMNTEEINEDIKDFQKEFIEFAKESSADDKEYNENLEEIKEQFADLREEINETYVEYARINRDAMEEAREEKVNKNSRIQNADASEEYEEEIKGLKKVRDGEMTKDDKRAARMKAKEIRKMEKMKKKEMRRKAKEMNKMK